MPDPQPIYRRPDESAADMSSLVQLGLAEPQPVPEPPAPTVPPDQTTQAQENRATLTSALTDAGVTKTPDDEQAINALARLNPADIAAVTRWIAAKNSPPDKTLPDKAL
ncbi:MULTISPECIES: hypothetical protein [unclassified Streptomyces]|uniref:hypothetical protein n=1 Tax=unclassified Streptomyces TaxID=2593676 RepID=UPI00278C2BDB|nr:MULTISPECIES: hypothetical protein [unclassified Streptomyces]